MVYSDQYNERYCACAVNKCYKSNAGIGDFMALINCPECRKSISDSAELCPNCGIKLTKERMEEAKKIQQKQIETGTTGCLIFIGIVVILGIIGSLVSPNMADLPPHKIAAKTSLPSGGKRIQINVENKYLSKEECVALINAYRNEAEPRGQVSVHKPSAKLENTMNPWCVDNMKGQGISFNEFLF